MAKKLPLFPTLGNVLGKTFKQLYGAMGFSFLLSLAVFIVSLPMIMAGFGMLGYLGAGGKHPVDYQIVLPLMVFTMLLLSLWNGLVAGPVTTALYGLYEIQKVDYPNWRNFGSLFKKNYKRSAAVYLVYSLVVTIFLINIMIGFSAKNILLFIAGIFSLYILLLAAMLQYYFHPLLYLDNSFKKVFRKAFLLVLDNIGLSFWLMVLIGLAPFLVLMIPVPIVVSLLMIVFMFAYGAFIIYLTSHGFELIYNKYDE